MYVSAICKCFFFFLKNTYFGLSVFQFIFTIYILLQSLTGTGNASKCYGNLGCLHITEDWYGLTRPVNVLPLDRHIINTQYSKIGKKVPFVWSRNCSDKQYYLKVKNQQCLIFFSHWSGAPSSNHYTALARERELVSQSQLFIPSCLSQPIRQWPVQEAWKEKFGLRYKLFSLPSQSSNAGCKWSPQSAINIFLYTCCFQLLRQFLVVHLSLAHFFKFQSTI